MEEDTKAQDYGRVFRKLRTLVNFKYDDLKSIMSKNGIVNLENGTSKIGFEKLDALLKEMGFTLSDFMYLIGDRSVNQFFGEAFHTIRYQRGYHSNFFVPIGVSPIRVKLFEEGKILLPYDTLDAMLELMHVPEQDFSYIMNRSAEDYFIHYVDLLDDAQLTRDTMISKAIEKEVSQNTMNQKPLPTILDEEKIFINQEFSEDYLIAATKMHVTRQYMDYRVLELTAKSCYMSLSEDEIIEIGDFLFGIDLWMEYSLGILALNAWQLPYSTIHGILSDIKKENAHYNGKLVYRRRIVQTGGRCAMTLTDRGELNQAENLLAMVKPFVHTIDTHSQGMYRFAEAFLDFKMGREVGNADMLKVIDTFDFLGMPSSRDFVQIYYDRHILKIER